MKSFDLLMKPLMKPVQRKDVPGAAPKTTERQAIARCYLRGAEIRDDLAPGSADAVLAELAGRHGSPFQILLEAHAIAHGPARRFGPGKSRSVAAWSGDKVVVAEPEAEEPTLRVVRRLAVGGFFGAVGRMPIYEAADHLQKVMDRPRRDGVEYDDPEVAALVAFAERYAAGFDVDPAPPPAALTTDEQRGRAALVAFGVPAEDDLDDRARMVNGSIRGSWQYSDRELEAEIRLCVGRAYGA